MISCSYTIEGIDNTHISGSCVLSGTTNYIFDISNFYAQSVVASGLLYRSYSMIIPLAVTEFILPVITVNGANKTIDITTGVGSRSPIFSGFLIATV